jgi:hypothetical protein
MLKTKKEPSKEEFQSNTFYFSYSSLVKLLTNPKQFYKEYILKEKEISDEKYLKEGELLHCFVLEPEMFDEKFVVSPAKLPGGGLKEVLDNVFYKYVVPDIEETNLNAPLENYRDEILSELEDMNLYQSYVDDKKANKNGLILTADDKRIEKCITEDTKKYYTALCESLKKTIVDTEMVATAKEKAEVILNNPDCQALLYATHKTDQIEKEIELVAEPVVFPFGFKGILDCLKVDNENKIIYVTDLKTTSTTLSKWQQNFAESEYMYWLQVIIYRYLVMNIIPVEQRGQWKLKIHFIVIDKYNDVYCFPVSANSLLQWETKAIETFKIAEWHYTQHEYSAPYQFVNKLAKL